MKTHAQDHLMEPRTSLEPADKSKQGKITIVQKEILCYQNDIMIETFVIFWQGQGY